MTLAAIAKELNTTTMTIYRRLKKADISIDQLRDNKTGEITANGANVIASLFDSAEPAIEHIATDEASQAAMNAAVLAAKLEAAYDTIQRLEAERDRLLRQLEAANAALEREQADRQHERQLLTGGNQEGQRRRRLFGWLQH